MESNILLIEDDATLRRVIKTSLEDQGFSVTPAHTWQRGLALAPSTDWALVIAGELPKETDRSQVLPELRKRSSAPVLMLTSQEAETSHAACPGADSYLRKPFNASDLSSRARALIDRENKNKTSEPDDGILEFNKGRLRLDPINRTLTSDGKPVELTAREFDLLLYLLRNKGRALTKKEIYNQVWKSDYIFDDNTIMVHIRRLRTKIEDNPSSPELILTVRGIGYRFSGI